MIEGSQKTPQPGTLKMEVTRKAIGVDVGGTHLRWALVSERGEVLRKEILPQSRGDSCEQVLNRLAAEWMPFIDRDLCGIGIGLPGSVEPGSGLLLRAPNLPSWVRVPIRKILAEKVGKDLPIVISNDANLYALGEGWKGAAQGQRSFLCATLGTGVGGGLILNGELWRGEGDSVAEFGHLNVEVGGRLCRCGQRGCLEAYASATAVVEQAEEDGALKRLLSHSSVIEARTISDLARKGIPEAVGLFNSVGKYLGIALGGAVNLLGLDAVVVGGGLSGSFDLFEETLLENMKRQIFSERMRGLPVLKAKLNQWAGPIGGARLALG